MHCVRTVTENLYWVGANDHRLALFENIHPIPKGVSYNAYLLLDEKSVLFDTVDWSACRQLLENLEYLLNGTPLDYLVINHMEPDHGASIEEILLRYPKVRIISTEKAFMLMRQFGFHVDGHECIQVKEGDTYSFGDHTVTFVGAPMVHWPEAMVTFDTTNGVLFSADAFGCFGALNGNIFIDELDYTQDWLAEARRYYGNIVGKYGPQVQAALKKLSALEIAVVCPLHGPIWRSDIDLLLDIYARWSSYEPEEHTVALFYGSMYGDSENAVNILAAGLADAGIRKIAVYDISCTHISFLIAEVFRCSHLVLTAPTYNSGIYPAMLNFLHDMKALNLQNRTVALIENGSWAPASGRQMRTLLEEMKQMKILEPVVTIKSSLKEDSLDSLLQLKESLAASLRDGHSFQA